MSGDATPSSSTQKVSPPRSAWLPVAPMRIVLSGGANLLAFASRFTFWVEDEGVASPDVQDARLFAQFRRSSDEGDRDESGIGLGLFIVRSIVERHGGTARLERTEQGRTRATVELPHEAPA